VRPEAGGDRRHLARRGHLEVERRDYLALEPLHVVVADMPPVLAEVSRDAIGAGEDGEVGGAHWIGMVAPPSVAHRRHMATFTPRRR
jgi:hypothetical protein